VLEHLAGQRPLANLKRTFARVDGRVVFLDGAIESDVQFVDTPTPIYDGIPFGRYLHYRPSTAPVLTRTERPHASLTLAHGCYWKKCTFCDVHLDYVGRYEPRQADPLVDQIEAIIAETGCRDFHWVDEAAPPALLRALSTLGVTAGRVPGFTGVWAGEEKIAAIGVRVASGGVTSHGFALNVAPDLTDFTGIVPCGITDRGVCSLASLGVETDVEAVAALVTTAFSEVFAATLVDTPRDRLLPADDAASPPAPHPKAC
jgi:hypothetical protein